MDQKLGLRWVSKFPCHLVSRGMVLGGTLTPSLHFISLFADTQLVAVVLLKSAIPRPSCMVISSPDEFHFASFLPDWGTAWCQAVFCHWKRIPQEINLKRKKLMPCFQALWILVCDEKKISLQQTYPRETACLRATRMEKGRQDEILGDWFFQSSLSNLHHH